jgi:hypothetical protein
VSGDSAIRAVVPPIALTLHRGWGKCLTPIPEAGAASGSMFFVKAF